MPSREYHDVDDARLFGLIEQSDRLATQVSDAGLALRTLLKECRLDPPPSPPCGTMAGGRTSISS